MNISLVRDSYASYGQGKEVVDALAASGIRFDFIVNNYVAAGGQGGISGYLTALNAFADAYPGSLVSIEGPNEANATDFYYNGLSSTDAIAAFQRDLYLAIKADGDLGDVPVYNVSLADNRPGSDTLGDLGNYSDGANVHAYPNTGRTADSQIAASIAKAQSLSQGDPVIVTETGYATLPTAGGIGTSETAQAKLILQNILDAYENGAEQVYIYDLIDSPSLGTADKPQEAFFGLFNADGSPKQAATAIHNLTTILQFGNDGTPTTAHDTGFTMSNAPSDAHSMVLTKSGDVYDIVLWTDRKVWDDVNDTDIVNSTSTVTVDLGETVTTVRVYDPLGGLTPIATYTNVSSFTVPLSDRPLVIEIGASAPVTEPAPAQVDAQLTLSSADFVAQMDELANTTGLVSVHLTDGNVLDVASPETMQYIIQHYGDLLDKIDGGYSFSVAYGQATWRLERLYDADGNLTRVIDYSLSNGIVTSKTVDDLNGFMEYYTYNIVGQTYTSQHQVVDSTGKAVLVERFHADGTPDYVKTVATDGTQTVSTYNAAGRMVTQVITGADGTITTDTYDPATGQRVQEIVDSASTYTTRTWTSGTLTKVIVLDKASGTTDHYLYNVTGQSYTTQHQVIDSTGKVLLVERFHADGTRDYTKSVAADGTQDTVTYNAAGQKMSEVVISPSGTVTTDTFDTASGLRVQQIIDSATTYTTSTWTNGTLTKVIALNKASGTTDHYLYNVTGQSYTTQHQVIEASGKITLVERFHADGTRDYTKTVSADGTQTTTTYNAAGQKMSDVTISPSGAVTTDLFDTSTGLLTQETMESSTDYVTKTWTNGVLTKVVDLNKTTGTTHYYTYGIVGQTYTSQHQVVDASGKTTLIERFHADGTLDYTKTIAADGTQDTTTYNAAGQKIGEVIISPSGTVTTDTYDAASGKLTLEIVESSSEYTTRNWTNGVLTKVNTVNKTTGYTDTTTYNIAGQTYTTQHQVVDATGKVVLIERFHADGTRDYTKTIGTDGTQTITLYNAAGQKMSAVTTTSGGTVTTDTYDTASGLLAQETIESSTDYVTKTWTNGVLTKMVDLNKTTGTTHYYTYAITGQTYTSQHQVVDASGKTTLIERFHADGTFDYTKAVAGDGTQETTTYNAAGQKMTKVIVSPNGAVTTDTYDPASGKITLEVVDSPTDYTTRNWTDGVLTKLNIVNKTTGVTDTTTYGITGQSYTTLHQVVDATGKTTLIERFHADGTFDYTKTVAADSTQDTTTYNAAGQKMTEVIISPSGAVTTDTYDTATGLLAQETIENTTDYVTKTWTNGVLTKMVDLNKTTGTTHYYTYAITGQTYTSQHQVVDASGKTTLIERFHADGTLDYTKTIAADGTQDTTTYNAAGQKVSEVIVAPNGTVTTDTFDPASGKVTLEVVDSPTDYTTRNWTDGVLTKLNIVNKTTGVTDTTTYGITGQSYTTLHQVVDASGKTTLIERFHADGTLDYTKTVAADGTQDVTTYNAAGQKVTEVITAPNGTVTTDTYDTASGLRVQQIVDSSTDYMTRTWTGGVLTKAVDLDKTTGTTHYYTYAITGQTYTSQHQVVDAAGKTTLIERFHADGTRDYTKTIAADGTQDTTTYNAAGQKVSEVIVAPNGTVTTDTYDPASGKITLEVVDGPAEYTTRNWTNGVLMKVNTVNKTTGYTDTYNYNISGQTYTTQHQTVDASGKVVLIERFHADGTRDYTKTIAADGTQDTTTYNTAGQKISEVIIAPNGTKTTDTFDPASGKITLEVVESTTEYTTRNWTNGVLMKVNTVNKTTGYTDTYNYNITGQTYTTQHQTVDATGKVVLIERFHADGTRDYTKTIAADGTQDTTTYNTAGQKISEVIIAPNGAKTTDTFDPASGKITLEVVDGPAEYTTRNWTNGVLMKVNTVNKTTGYTDTYNYNITGQTYTTQHQTVDAAGKVVLIERFHADGTRDYTKTIATDGTQDTTTYNTAGQKISEIILAPNGTKTTDTYDPISGKLTQEIIDSSTDYVTKTWTSGVLTKIVDLNKTTGVTDYFTYNITGQTYTSQHQQTDASGKTLLVERFHADGTYDYREVPHTDGSKDTWMYDSKGTLLAHYEIHTDGSRVVDNYLQDGSGDIRHDTFAKDLVLLLRDYEHTDGTHTVYSYTAGQDVHGGATNDIVYLRGMANNTYHYDGGTDTLLNFDAGTSHILIEGGLAHSASDLHLTQTGSDVTVSIDSTHSLVLKDMQLANVSSSIFLFQ
ncbi:hypothetical protein V5F49_03165 [Xanthobacter sp. V3C-3]|uniref:hypothetical protein n=1 Tax=Xanthobacter lutulentifluminis TaxID=3119935 RepID=UPI00372BFCEB